MAVGSMVMPDYRTDVKTHLMCGTAKQGTQVTHSWAHDYRSVDFEGWYNDPHLFC